MGEVALSLAYILLALLAFFILCAAIIAGLATLEEWIEEDDE